METASALLVLGRAGLPDAAFRTLLDAWPDPAQALAAARGGALPLAPEIRSRLRAPDAEALASDHAWLSRPGNHVLAWNDPDYPPLLRQAPSPPPLLFLAGDPSLFWHPQIAIVGSRRPTPGGRERARAFAEGFAAGGWAITSGLADGIDAAAHLGALARGRTLAVVGTGPDRCYPAKNAALQSRIAASGLVVSEHPPGTDPRIAHFPSRNRIIAGLALGTVVVEAALRSGALITARLAAEAGREAFAIPGSPDNPMARGCHALIRNGATLVETPADVVAALAPLAASLAGALRGRLAEAGEGPGTASGGGSGDSAATQPPADPDHSRLWSALGFDPTPLDSLVVRTGLTVTALSSILLTMELDGRIVVDNGRYARRS